MNSMVALYDRGRVVGCPHRLAGGRSVPRRAAAGRRSRRCSRSSLAARFTTCRSPARHSSIRPSSQARPQPAAFDGSFAPRLECLQSQLRAVLEACG